MHGSKYPERNRQEMKVAFSGGTANKEGDGYFLNIKENPQSQRYKVDWEQEMD